jgi:hypothetical protein
MSKGGRLRARRRFVPKKIDLCLGRRLSQWQQYEGDIKGVKAVSELIINY